MSDSRQRLRAWLGVALSLGASAVWSQAQEPSETENPTFRRGGVLDLAREAKSMLQLRGIEPQARYLSELAANVSGGDARLLRETGELDLAARFDMDKLFGIHGGTLQATITWRRGENLVRDAGLDTLELVQANYGRGQTARLTQFWYQQEFADARFDVKLGRLTAGEDFAAFSCDFMNLSLCGARPGSVVSEYWYNWPISQWAMRWRYRGPNGSAQIGAFEVNPKNLEENFTIGRFSGASGVLVPVEVALTPALGANRLPGVYKLGAWYDSSPADDVLLDINRASRSVSELRALQRHGRYGAYAQVRQQLTGRADGAEPSGLALFLNVVQAERRTSRLDRQIGIGLTYASPRHGSAPNEVGVAITTTRVNRRFASYQHSLGAAQGVQESEYLAEIYAEWVVVPWLSFQPNVQYIVSPGGYSDRDDVAVLGVRVTTAFN